jgi:nickel-dependent lactate racemase
MAGLAFIVNAVLNSRQEMVKTVAGDRIQAHREGIKYVDRMYRRTISRLADIAVASCGGFPKDQSLYQAQKGLENASQVVREGGTIILLAECGEMYGNRLFEEWISRARSPDDPLRWLQEQFVLGAHKAAALCRVVQKKEVFLISRMPNEAVENCFLQPAETVEQALAKALEKHGPHAQILVLPTPTPLCLW